MADAARSDITTPEGAGALIGEKIGVTVRSVQDLRDRLKARWEELNARASSTGTPGPLPALRQELRDDADYVVTRARYYHEIRPLSAVGMVAAAAFVVGAAIGFGRH